MRATAILIVTIWAAPALAQTNQVATPPPNFVIPNYNAVPAGPFGGLEGVAHVARASDPSAAWFNPAGLSSQRGPQISGSAGIYQLTRVSPSALPNQGGSVQQVPNSVGFTFEGSDRLTLGAALLTTTSWDQKTSSQIVNTIALGEQRFAFSADSEFSRRLLAMSAGYRTAGAWRFGGGLALEFTDLRLVQGISDRIADAATLRTLVVSSQASGSAIQLRSVVGTQYERSKIRAGLAIRTPALTMKRSGGLTLEGTLDAGEAALGASLFDQEARFEAPLPWEFHGGVAYVGPRMQVEVDLQAYTPIDEYSMLSTEQPTVIYGDAGLSSAPTVFTQPFPGLRSSARGFVNGAVGGHVRLFRDRELRLHGGLAMDRSPVEADDGIFGRIDLLSWTIGASGQFRRFQFALGLNRRSGTADDVVVENLIGGRTVTTPLKVRTIGFIYSLAYQF
jgi:hypothetical protein